MGVQKTYNEIIAFAIDKEQDPSGPREFDQAIDKAYRGIGFTAAGGSGYQQVWHFG